MNEVLRAIGIVPSAARRTWLGLLVAATTLLVVLAPHFLYLFAGWAPWLIQISVWLVWLVWLGWLFPMHRARDLRGGSPWPYRAAFYRDVLPGVCTSFAQMARPALYGAWTPAGMSVAIFVAAAICLVLGATLVICGMKELGIANAMFVNEYRAEGEREALRCGGVYGVVRHPLFTGGMIGSFGMSVLAGGDALPMGCANLLVLFPYLRLENARCRQVYGAPYRDYQSEVSGVLPTKAWWLRRRRDSNQRSA